MPVVVRRASTVDAELVSSLHAETQAVHAAALPSWFKPPGPDAFPPSAAAALIATATSLLLIAEVDRAPVGYAYAEVVHQPEDPFRYAHDLFFVRQIGIQASHRRKGAGAALLAAIRLDAESRGMALIAVDVWTFNEEARAFFACQGFMPYTERMWLR